jgi:CopG-like RHH_1 or ribbon-helix-helix domain, RHH_5
MTMAKKTIRIKGAEVTEGGSIDLDVEDVRLADGARLTEARAQELAQQVLRAAGRGRPSLTAPGERSPQLRLSVPEQLREGLRARADAEHRSVSELAREAIERYLAS